MKNRTERTPRSEAFRLAIAAFIDERREAKLKGKEPDADAASKYDFGAWLADAARRASQIQAVTPETGAIHASVGISRFAVTAGTGQLHFSV